MRVTPMKSAADIGGTDVADNRFIHSEFMAAKAFAHVTI
jgi:hypothetical protein